jgi:Flp pilus assembly protein TadG
MLESALVLLTFLLLIFGTIDFGQVLFFQQSLVERARAATRYGVTNPTDTTGIRNMAVYNSSTVTGSPAPILAGLTTAMVSVSNPDANTSAARVIITISGYPMRFYSPYISGAFTALSVTVVGTAETQVP